MNVRSVVAVSALLICSLLASGQASANMQTGARRSEAQTIPASANVIYWTWQNVNSDLCLGITGSNMTNGTKAIQWPCTGVADQYWSEVGIDDGAYYEFRNIVNPAKCLAVPGSSLNPGTQLVIWTCSGNPDQFWRVTRVAFVNGVWVHRITNYNSGLSIAVPGSSLTPGAPVVQWPYTGNPDQWWR